MSQPEPLATTATLYEESLEEIRSVYLADERPWVIGFSGGKDSTVALQLVWYALRGLDPSERHKPVYVISGDTQVETPVIVDYLTASLEMINEHAKAEGLPISAHKVTPDLGESFWVNLLGKGYPAPSSRFRWCTARMKISPANRFILERVAEHGEVVLLLGVRSQESATRAQVMSLRRIKDSLLSRHSTLPNAFVYTPIRDYSVDEVWQYLLQVSNPWGRDNNDLLALYRNSSAGECPLVVDTSTPSCGSSRFGCWVCTVVTKDKAMEAMVDNGDEWLEPLLELRDFLADTQNPKRKVEVRQHVRKNGGVMPKKYGDKEDPFVRGPYTLEFCQELLGRLLTAERRVREMAPDDQQVQLISLEELLEIRRIWRYERQDWHDRLPAIFKEATGQDLELPLDDQAFLDGEDEALLGGLAAEHDVPLGLVKKLIDTERDMQGLRRRAKIMDEIEGTLSQEWRSEGDETLLQEMEEAEAAA
ncbi:MAG TPA: DNA phosphorothioation system sulfurtransferase DndC [Solirubrobacterales bacterium]|nr:DNA phosphorothioation system sulfurtransferase DndC [Solirubrobacterales bacterium]